MDQLDYFDCFVFKEALGIYGTEYVLRFRGQTQLYKSKPSEFQMAIEEAVLAENGFLDSGFGTGKVTTESEECPREVQEATTSSQGLEYYSRSQVIIF